MHSHQCGGSCCRRFLIGDNSSPEDLKNMYLGWAALHRDGTSNHLVKTAEKHYSRSLTARNLSVDIHLVYPMLIYLGEFDWNPCDPDGPRLEEKVHHYTCKHFDTKTNLCTIYDIRPSMCVMYPNHGPCMFPDCQIPGNKEKLEQIKREREERRAKDKELLAKYRAEKAEE